ncbi:MAG: lipopolysaccharide transport periplasmic protein LptA [Oleiphilaceae bacterium]|nr:lipopolysaccharide transport periplasmic protein LptA [Oleiphilaceae bacterium]
MTQRVYILALGLLFSLPAAAFDLESDAPVTINSDKARLDDAQGRATYTGDVVVTQEGTQLDANRVELYRDNLGLSRMEAFGTPARYQQPASQEQAEIDARALTITYDARDEQITFEEQAVIHQGSDTFRGQRIVYSTSDRVVTAESGPDASDRVEMTIQPRNQNEEQR